MKPDLIVGTIAVAAASYAHHAWGVRWRDLPWVMALTIAVTIARHTNGSAVETALNTVRRRQP